MNGPTEDHLRIEAHKIKSKEGGLVGGKPGVLEVVVLVVSEIVLDRNTQFERLLHAHFVFLGKWVLFLVNGCVRPCKAEKERVERLPLGLVTSHGRHDVGKGEGLEAAVGESEIAAKEMGFSAPNTRIIRSCD